MFTKNSCPCLPHPPANEKHSCCRPDMPGKKGAHHIRTYVRTCSQTPGSPLHNALLHHLAQPTLFHLLAPGPHVTFSPAARRRHNRRVKTETWPFSRARSRFPARSSSSLVRAKAAGAGLDSAPLAPAAVGAEALGAEPLGAKSRGAEPLGAQPQGAKPTGADLHHARGRRSGAVLPAASCRIPYEKLAMPISIRTYVLWMTLPLSVWLASSSLPSSYRTRQSQQKQVQVVRLTQPNYSRTGVGEG